MMKQYLRIKQKNPDAVLLFRMGDFFETFLEDAEITSRVCGITLTKRNSGLEEANLAGFPHHQLDVYLPKLVRAGYKVAVCEQLEDPKLARGIVKRGIVEVVTPGVALYDKLLQAKTNNYLACLTYKTNKDGSTLFGFAAIDVSTGEFSAAEFGKEKLQTILENFRPSEILISKTQKSRVEIEIGLLNYKPTISKIEDWFFDEEFAREALTATFGTKSLKGFGIENYTVGIVAAGATLQYIKETQVTGLDYVKEISAVQCNDFMALDFATRRNLEITFSAFGESNPGETLFDVLDKTCTPMGGRMLKRWVTQPLLESEKINRRLSSVDSLFKADKILLGLRQLLAHIGDIERLVAKICNGRANPRDVVALKNSVNYFPDLKFLLSEIDNPALNEVGKSISGFEDLANLIETALLEEPSVQLGTANVFKKGYNAELDDYVDAKTHASDWMKSYQEKERKLTDISTLKVGFTSVFGYYIEVSKANRDKAPERYERRQTLTNAERYITPELKDFEEKILSAESKINELEQALFTELRLKISQFAGQLQQASRRIAIVDCLESFATVAKENRYVKPEIDDSEVLEIIGGRHPVVEKMLPVGEKYIPNDTFLDCKDNRIHIITGPNMAGKSCYLRQVGLIVLLGQIGSFVPAVSAKFGVIDRIFTRVGASDNITSGESTFLVEMQEVANILHNASRRSLLLLDEIGRGTATFDGISIAWAMTEYIHDSLGAKALFATHYHELNDLKEAYFAIRNFQVQVVETVDKVMFLHKVIEGGADHSYGIYVAKMAGVPSVVITRAQEIMKSLEDDAENKSKIDDKQSKMKSSKAQTASIPHKKRTDDLNQISIFEIRDDMIRERLRGVELDNITPFQALELLRDIKEKFM